MLVMFPPIFAADTKIIYSSDFVAPLSNPEVYSEPCQTSKIECFAKIVNG